MLFLFILLFFGLIIAYRYLKINKKKIFLITIFIVSLIFFIRGGMPLIAGIISGIAVILPFLDRLFRLILSSAFVINYFKPNKTTYNPVGSKKEMSIEEAKDILNIKGTPTKESIKTAYHKMMLKNHPDQGGSDYLAGKINQAKEALMKEYGNS